MPCTLAAGAPAWSTRLSCAGAGREEDTPASLAFHAVASVRRCAAAWTRPSTTLRGLEAVRRCACARVAGRGRQRAAPARRRRLRGPLEDPPPGPGPAAPALRPRSFLQNLPNLEHLDLSGNDLTYLPPSEFSTLLRLKSLNLRATVFLLSRLRY